MSSKSSGRKKKARTPASMSVTPPPSSANTQSDDEDFTDEEDHIKVATFTASIVGLRYYSGVAHTGEYVNLVREPENPYDPNAIRVDNMAGEKVGHIKRQQAAVLAPFMDSAESRGLELEGTIPFPGNQFSMSCTVDFLARAPSTELQQRALTLVQELKKAFGSKWSFKMHVRNQRGKKKESTLAAIESKRMDWASQARELDELFEKQSGDQLKNLPDINMPSEFKSKLLPFQEQGLKWLVHKDTTPQMPFFSETKEKSKKVWHCSISNSSQPNQPKAFQGGALCDMMGLGKTTQMIAMFLAAPPATPEDPQCTLVVCPVSVMANWEQQIDQHVQDGVLKVGHFQGTNREKLLPKIESGEINVLLVSYQTLAADYTKVFGKKGETPPSKKRAKVASIFQQKFHRIVLDEAHTIRNTRARMFLAVNQLQANRKWCLTGTPLVNRGDDIFALLHFLGVEPLNDKKIYQRAITIPMQQGDDTGLACLRVAMAHVALRRSKASANIQLVEKTVLLKKVPFPDKSPHTITYSALFGTIRRAFQAVMQDGDQEILKNYTNIFEKLLRLRQACCSAHLVPKERRQRALEIWKEIQKLDASSKPQLTAKEGLELLEKLKGAFSASETTNELPECAVCLMEMEETQCTILRTCSHVYCEPCIERVFSGKHNPSCPLCRQPFTKQDMIQKSMASSAVTQSENDEPDDDVTMDDEFICASPKIEALLETIKTSMKPDEKGVIFSQFTGFLDLIQAALKGAGHSFTRLDGSMSSTKRIEVVRKFSSDDQDSPRFILCSLHAAGTGINLTRGSTAFCMDAWWNTAVENQAMDRIHRIGQARPVTVHRFVMKDSLEERIVDLQEAKSMQAKGAMEKLNPEEKRKARLDDLKGLLMIDSE